MFFGWQPPVTLLLKALCYINLSPKLTTIPFVHNAGLKDFIFKSKFLELALAVLLGGATKDVVDTFVAVSSSLDVAF